MEQPNSTHLDFNFSESLDQFRQYDVGAEQNLPVGNTSTLVKHFVFYLAWKYQTANPNLFNNIITINVDEFCEMTQYKKTHLLSAHPLPYQQLQYEGINKRLKFSDYIKDQAEIGNNKVFTSILENAMYRLVTQPLVLSAEYKHIDSMGQQVSHNFVKGVPIIETLEVTQVKSKNGKIKKYYQVGLSDMMCKNFSRLFTPVDYRKLVSIRKLQIDDLYVFLRNLKKKLAYSENPNIAKDYTFDDLCRIGSVSFSEPRKNKSVLNKKFSLINEKTELKVRLNWTDKFGNISKAGYRPVIEFDMSVPDLQPIDKREILFNNFCRDLLSHLPSLDTIVDENGNQIFTPNMFPTALPLLLRGYSKHAKCASNFSFCDTVSNAYLAAQILTFGKHTDSTKYGATIIFDQLRAVQTIDDIKEALYKAYNPGAKEAEVRYGKNAKGR